MRLQAKHRESLIINAAIIVALRDGLVCATASTVSQQCSAPTSPATVKWYFSNNEQLWRAILNHPDCTDELKVQGAELGL